MGSRRRVKRRTGDRPSKVPADSAKAFAITSWQTCTQLIDCTSVQGSVARITRHPKVRGDGTITYLLDRTDKAARPVFDHDA